MKKYRRKRKYVSPEATEQKIKRQPKHYKRRIRIKKGKRVFSLCLFVVLFVAAIMVFTPVFNIDKVTFIGNSVQASIKEVNIMQFPDNQVPINGVILYDNTIISPIYYNW